MPVKPFHTTTKMVSQQHAKSIHVAKYRHKGCAVMKFSIVWTPGGAIHCQLESWHIPVLATSGPFPENYLLHKWDDSDTKVPNPPLGSRQCLLLIIQWVFDVCRQIGHDSTYIRWMLEWVWIPALSLRPPHQVDQMVLVTSNEIREDESRRFALVHNYVVSRVCPWTFWINESSTNLTAGNSASGDW